VAADDERTTRRAEKPPVKGEGRARAKKEISAGGVVFRRTPEDPIRFLLIRDSYGHWGFPKGHLERHEGAAEAAIRETHEETGLEGLRLHGPVATIDWYFRLRGRLIHKYCHFFLLESTTGEPTPQLDEGITECRWYPVEEALTQLGYENARTVLRKATELTQALPS
jgi:8-oxo-dGTP pyrophosphatase MutT (NUDIX family)